MVHVENPSLNLLFGFSIPLLIEEKDQKQVKQFFRDKHIILKLISDDEMLELLNHCNELSGK